MDSGGGEWIFSLLMLGIGVVAGGLTAFVLIILIRPRRRPRIRRLFAEDEDDDDRDRAPRH